MVALRRIMPQTSLPSLVVTSPGVRGPTPLVALELLRSTPLLAGPGQLLLALKHLLNVVRYFRDDVNRK